MIYCANNFSTNNIGNNQRGKKSNGEAPSGFLPKSSCLCSDVSCAIKEWRLPAYILSSNPDKITIWRCLLMSKSKNETNKRGGRASDEQAVRGKLSKQFDHELANEPLTAAEKYNNKKTKKRQ